MDPAPIGPAHPCYVIAEAGVNHNGDLSLAKDLVDAAVTAGADAVKFQTFETDQLVTDRAETAEYQRRSGHETQSEMLRDLELDAEAFAELRAYCTGRGIEFLSTPYDRGSVDVLEALDLHRYKVASADIVNKPLLRRLAETGSQLIVSTGMATPEEILRALGWLAEFGVDDVVVLHCVSSYPAEFDTLDLRFVETLTTVLDCPVGYSDHTLGTEAPVAATALGATVVEKHFTLDRSMDGPDHEASLEPDELERMVTAIRNVEASMGSAIKHLSAGERDNAAVMRRSVHAATDIAAGEPLTAENTSLTRPNDGLEPAELERVLGTTVSEDVTAGDPITRDTLT